MTLSTFSIIIGIMELLIGIPLLISPQKTGDMLKRAMTQDILMRFIAAIFLCMAALVLLQDHRIGSDVAGLMTLVAWLVAIKQVLVFWYYERMITMSEKWLGNTSRLSMMGVVACVIGVLFLMAGNTLA